MTLDVRKLIAESITDTLGALTIPPPKALPMTLSEVEMVVTDHESDLRYIKWAVGILLFLVWVLLVTRR